MKSRLKLALVILWAGTAAGIAIGYFSGNYLLIYIGWLGTAFVVTYFILAESKKEGVQATPIVPDN